MKWIHSIMELLLLQTKVIKRTKGEGGFCCCPQIIYCSGLEDGRWWVIFSWHEDWVDGRWDRSAMQKELVKIVLVKIVLVKIVKVY